MDEETRKALEEWWKIAKKLNDLSKLEPLTHGKPVPRHSTEDIDKMLKLCEEEKNALERYRRILDKEDSLSK